MARIPDLLKRNEPAPSPDQELLDKIDVMVKQTVCHPTEIVNLAMPNLYNLVDIVPYRAQLQLVADFIYHNKHDSIIYQRLRNRYKVVWNDYRLFINPAINPLKKITDILAILYKRAPVRIVKDGNTDETKDGKGNQFLRDSIIDIDLTMNRACKMAHYAGNPVIWPVFIEAQKKILLRVVPAHEVGISLAPDYKFDMVANMPEFNGSFALSIWNPKTKTRESKWVKYTDGKPTITDTYVLGTPIFVSQTRDMVQPWEVFDMLDIIRGTLRIGEKETFDEKIDFFKSFKQLVATPPQVGMDLPPSVEVGPDTIATIDGLDAMDLADKDLAYQESIDKLAASYAAMRGISSLTFWGDYQSKEQQQAISAEVLHHWQSQKVLWEGIEKELWASVFALAVAAKLLPAKAMKWEVETIFVSPDPSEDDQKSSLEVFDLRERAGLTSIIERIMQENSNITSRQEAWDYFRANLQTLAVKIRMQRELQTPQEPITVDTEEKAAVMQKATQIVEGKLTGPEGAEGPSMVDEIPAEEKQGDQE